MGTLRVRVDDFPGTKPEEFWRHNVDNFRRFDRVMTQHGFPYVLGVIPRHTDDSQLRFLGELSMCEVAMHGVNHDESTPNEFRAHLTEREVYQAILSAKTPLSELAGPVDSYIPPHNVIDARTCNALKSAGFRRLFGGPGSDHTTLDFARYIGLEVCYSQEPLEYGRSDELIARGATEHIVKQLESRDVWLTLHWTWEWNVGLESLEKLLNRFEGVERG